MGQTGMTALYQITRLTPGNLIYSNFSDDGKLLQ